MADIKTKLIVDTKDAKKSVGGLTSAFKGLVAAASVQQFVKLGDEFTQISNRLKSVSDSNAEAEKSFALVSKVAAETRSGLGPVADLFTDLTIATEEMGLSQERVASIAGTFSKALKISGADANASSGAIRQFGQALASGVLRGDEFNSIMEANPAFMRAVAGELDVTIGQLRKMAAAGELSSDVLVAATEAIGGAIDEDFGKTVATVGESFTALQNSIITLLGEIQNKTGLFTTLAKGIELAADNVGILAVLLGATFAAKAVVGIINMVNAVRALQIVTKAQAVAQAAVLALSGPAGWGILAGAAIATTAAVVALNKTFEETESQLKDSVNAMGDVVKEGDAATKNAKQLAKEAKDKANADKEAKKDATELARITANQMEDLKAITGELALGSDELRDQLDFNADLARASDVQKQTLSDIARLESDRTQALIDLNALTLVNADQRKLKEQEINDEYDERIRLTQEANEELLAIGTMQQAGRFFNQLTAASRDYKDELALLTAAQLGQSREELRNLSELITLYGQTEKKLEAINEAFFGVGAGGGIHNDIAQDMVKAGEMTQATADEYAKRIEDFNKYEADMRKLLETFQEDREEIEAKGTKFGSGFQQAFENFERNVKDAASAGKKIFDTMATGFEDALVSFVETGKLSFKDLFKSLLVEIIKMQANKLFLTLFGAGSPFGSLFAGLFANGGSIPSGKVGLTGESGPEFVTGPATVISARDTAAMMGGGQQVTYNINAVDTQSFQQALARDPEFLFNVTQRGRRSLPSGA